MGIGISIFLIAVGAILKWAVHATVAGVDIHVVGWILMGAGAIGLIWSLILFAPRRRNVVTESVVEQPGMRQPLMQQAPPGLQQQPVVEQPVARETRFDDTR